MNDILKIENLFAAIAVSAGFAPLLLALFEWWEKRNK